MRLISYVALFAVAGACSSAVVVQSTPSGEGGASASGGGGNAAVGSTAGPGGSIGPGPSTGGSGGGCEDIVLDPIYEQVPADIVFVIGNSVSLVQEISAFESTVNSDFAQPLNAANTDYQVIMLTQHGAQSHTPCVGPPLSGTTNCAAAPVFVPGQFYHYSAFLFAADTLCKIFSTLHGAVPDMFGQAPNGWEPWLRTEAEKYFIVLTDDGIGCTYNSKGWNDGDSVAMGQQVAIDADLELLSLSSQFGTSSDRRYHFHPIVGMFPNGNLYYDEFDPVVPNNCLGAVGSGTGYQWLSKGTGGKRFSSCAQQSYAAYMQTIAADIIDASTSACRFTLPPPPMGEIYDYNAMDLNYTPGGSGSPQSLVRVDALGLCMPGAFYIESGEVMVLCPQTCSVVEADAQAKLEAIFYCWFDY